jgi:RNA polymerase sigma-70 factor (ECF subfamily)
VLEGPRSLRYIGALDATTVILAALATLRGDEHGAEQSLMELLCQRDQTALEQLYDRYSTLVYSLLLRITQEAASAEDLTQEVFLKVWRNAHLYESSRGSLEAWLVTVARNLALDHVRSKREKQRRREDTTTLAVAVSRPRAEEWVDRRKRIEQVRSLMTSLPPEQRRSLELAYFEGLTQSEIAARLDQPLGTVKSWLRNALLRLRDELGGRS